MSFAVGFIFIHNFTLQTEQFGTLVSYSALSWLGLYVINVFLYALLSTTTI